MSCSRVVEGIVLRLRAETCSSWGHSSIYTLVQICIVYVKHIHCCAAQPDTPQSRTPSSDCAGDTQGGRRPIARPATALKPRSVKPLVRLNLSSHHLANPRPARPCFGGQPGERSSNLPTSPGCNNPNQACTVSTFVLLVRGLSDTPRAGKCSRLRILSRRSLKSPCPLCQNAGGISLEPPCLPARFRARQPASKSCIHACGRCVGVIRSCIRMPVAHRPAGHHIVGNIPCVDPGPPPLCKSAPHPRRLDRKFPLQRIFQSFSFCGLPDVFCRLWFRQRATPPAGRRDALAKTCYSLPRAGRSLFGTAMLGLHP